MKSVSILATGSEVVSGQIINTNAAWLSQRLIDLNLEVVYHWVVADNPAKILEALDYLSQRTDAVFVTGGLGPTTDDLTRKIVAEWLGLELQLQESEWERIQQRVSALQIEARAGHKWQAYFPEGSEVYVNLMGTASGFSLRRAATQSELYFLPGPPIEMQYIWETHLAARIKSLAPADGLKLLTWQFIELPESEVAYIADTVAEELKFLSGYRAIPPIVEFKLWVPPDFDPTISEPILRLENELKDHLHSVNEFNYLEGFLMLCLRQNPQLALSIEDRLTDGEFLNRIVSLKKDHKDEFKKINYSYATAEIKEPLPLHLEIHGVKNENVHLKLWDQGQLILDQKIQTQRVSAGLRFKIWVCEVVSKSLYQYLSEK